MDSFQKRIKELSDTCKLDAEYIINLLTPHYQIFTWQKKQKYKTISQTKFKNHIEFTKNTLDELSQYVINDGYKKLAERCEYLLKELELYNNNKKTLSGIKRFFNNTFEKSLPTENNILSIATENLENYLSEHNLQDFSQSFIQEIFDVKKFNRNLKYSSINIKIDKNTQSKIEVKNIDTTHTYYEG